MLVIAILDRIKRSLLKGLRSTAANVKYDNSKTIEHNGPIVINVFDLLIGQLICKNGCNKWRSFGPTANILRNVLSPNESTEKAYLKL